MRLYIVRHGETDWNKQRRIQGRADIMLNNFGRSLAKKTGAGLADVPFSVCYSSPLRRAKETARLILDGRDVPVTEDDRIIEMAFGEYEGKCCSKRGWELPDNFRNFFNDPENYRAPSGGENFADVMERTQSFLDELCHMEKHQGENILVVTHGAALAGILANIKGRKIQEYWGTGVHKNCGVTVVEVSDGRPAIIQENVVYYDDEIEPWEDV